MKKLFKSKTDRKLCGVCAGIAEYLNIDPTLMRLGTAVVTLFSIGFGLIVYFIAALIIPDQP